MIRFSWMWRNSSRITGLEMSDIIDELEQFEYYSILFPIRSTSADFLPQIIRSINPNQKIKYMIPIRPYLLSPQYLAMLSAGIERIAPKRTIFNFIHGHVEPFENMDGIIHSSLDFSTKDARRIHLEKFINSLHALKIDDAPDFSEALISGGNYSTIEIAKRVGVDVATSYESFIRNKDKSFINNQFKKIFMQLSVLPRDTLEHAEMVAKKSNAIAKNQSGILYGTFEQIADKIKELESFGITDILISNAFDGGQEERLWVHEFVKYFNGLEK